MKNSEKAEVIDAMRPMYRLKDLLKLFNISKSSYFYSIHVASHDKYAELRERLRAAFDSVGGCYGYRRIRAVLKRSGVAVSEKVVRSLDHYIRWYNNERIKESLGWLSPLEYRQSFGLTG